MEYRTVQQIVGNIISTIEQTSVVAVRVLKENIFDVTVKNFPRTQAVKGTIIVGNQGKVEEKLDKHGNIFTSILDAIRGIKPPTEIKVTNFPSQKEYPQFPTEIKVSNFPPERKVLPVEISNHPIEQLQNLILESGKIVKAVKGLKLDPTIKVEAPKLERVIVPPAQVTLNEKEIDYEKMAESIAEQIPQIDYKKLTKAMSSMSISVSGGNGGSSFRTSDGTQSGALVDDDRHLQVDVLTIPTINVEADIEYAETPTIYNITMTNLDTEYSQALPTNTKKVEFWCRGSYDVRFAFVTGKVATPTAPYMTLKAGLNAEEDGLKLVGKTIYFACGTAGQIIELLVWT